MNIQTVATNLRNTIEGKEKYLAEITVKLAGEDTDGLDRIVIRTTIEFLKININELKVILFDVEKCCEQATLASWEQNPDRSGGQFTQEEINRGNEWH